jgi:hypothetical protein
VSSTGKIGFYLIHDWIYSNGIAVTSKIGNFDDNNWHHVIVTYDGSSNVNGVKVYVDGELMNLTTHFNSLTGTISGTGFGVDIGSRPTQKFFDGTIDEVKIYNRALTENQVKSNYNNRYHLIVSEETKASENWSVEVTPNDNTKNGEKVLSNNLTINLPKIDEVVLNISNGNLTANSINLEPTNSKLIYDWKLNGEKIAYLNMPFDGEDDFTNIRDYASGWNFTNHIPVPTSIPVYNQAGGVDGRGAYYFDGIDDVLWTYDDNPDLSGGEITVMAWFKGSNSQRMLTQQYDNNNYIIFGHGSDCKHLIAGEWEYDSVDCGDDSIIEDGNWHHIAFTWKKYTAGGFISYVDGVAVANSDSSGFEIYNLGSLGTEINIGGWGNELMEGYIDEVKVFKRALSPEQIKAIYENRNDLIVNEETRVNENWSVCATPNDNTEDGITVCNDN